MKHTLMSALIGTGLIAGSSDLAAEALTARISVIAGTGDEGFGGDGGPALKAQFRQPFGIVRGPDGALYVTDWGDQRIRRIGSDGIVSTVAGNGQAGHTGDGGPAMQASLNKPHEIAFDREGLLYIADTSNHVVRRVDLQRKTIDTIAGTGGPGSSGDGGPALEAQVGEPISTVLGRNGDLYFADVVNHSVRSVNLKTGLISTLAGSGKPGIAPEQSPLLSAPLNSPRSLAVAPNGDLWLVTRQGNQLFHADLRAGVIHHVGGTGEKGLSGDGGPALKATLSGPKNITVAPDGRVYVADTDNNVIRRYDPKTKLIERVLGNGEQGAHIDSDPLKTQLNQPHGVWLEKNGALLVADSFNHRIIRLMHP